MFAKLHSRRSLDSFSRPTRTPRHPSPNSHRILSFTSFASLTSSKSFSVNLLSDPHPLNPVASIFYKNIGGTDASPFFKLSTFNLQHSTFDLLESSPFFSSLYTLFCATKLPHLLWNQFVAHSFDPDGGCTPSRRIPPLTTHHSSFIIHHWDWGGAKSVLLAS